LPHTADPNGLDPGTYTGTLVLNPASGDPVTLPATTSDGSTGGGFYDPPRDYGG
jgi:hypothetical protein